MNMKTKTIEKKASSILSVLGNPFRVKLVLALGEQEACVCHLETLLKKRQAYISQHLMALRNAGLLKTRREGKYIYYRLSDPAIIELIKDAALLGGVNLEILRDLKTPIVLEKCICPHCEHENSSFQKMVEPLDNTINV
jgi:DNA-binding transcriptional ArsR family regulator